MKRATNWAGKYECNTFEKDKIWKQFLRNKFHLKLDISKLAHIFLEMPKIERMFKNGAAYFFYDSNIFHPNFTSPLPIPTPSLDLDYTTTWSVR